MFFASGTPHGLRHNPFNAIVVPRPIGWISTVDATGNANLAPYSFFNAVAYTPPQVIFSATGNHATDGGFKDSVANVEATGEFVVNLATWDLREAMNRSAAPAPHGVDEFEIVQPQFSCLPPHRRRLLAGADDAKSHALLSQQMCRVENHIDSVQGQKSSVKQNPT